MVEAACVSELFCPRFLQTSLGLAPLFCALSRCLRAQTGLRECRLERGGPRRTFGNSEGGSVARTVVARKAQRSHPPERRLGGSDASKNTLCLALMRNFWGSGDKVLVAAAAISETPKGSAVCLDPWQSEVRMKRIAPSLREGGASSGAGALMSDVASLAFVACAGSRRRQTRRMALLCSASAWATGEGHAHAERQAPSEMCVGRPFAVSLKWRGGGASGGKGRGNFR